MTLCRTESNGHDEETMRRYKRAMNRREFLGNGSRLAAGLTVLPSIAGENPMDAPRQPNLLFILTDQQPWFMTGARQRSGMPLATPNLDKLAIEGARFDQFFAFAPVCSPNRACLLTGRYPQQHGVVRNTGASAIDHRNGYQLRTGEPTMGELFRNAGYETAYIGKWHLYRETNIYVPELDRHGFDHWVLNDKHDNAPHFFEEESRYPETSKDEHTSDFLTRKAIEFMQDKAGSRKPFCMVVSYPDPHNGPAGCKRPPFQERIHETWRDIQLPPSYHDTLARLERGQLHELEKWLLAQRDKFLQVYPRNFGKLYAEMRSAEDVYKVWIAEFLRRVELIDENLGRLIDHLKRSGELDNTIIVFTSDHGEMAGAHLGFTKSYPYEESVRVPLFIRFPRLIPPRVSEALGSSVDLLPTLCDLAGIEGHEGMAGTSLAAIATGEKESVQDTIAMALYDWTAVRSQSAKLIRSPRWSTDFLFDLADDPGELRNRASDPACSGLRSDLQGAMSTWCRRLL